MMLNAVRNSEASCSANDRRQPSPACSNRPPGWALSAVRHSTSKRWGYQPGPIIKPAAGPVAGAVSRCTPSGTIRVPKEVADVLGVTPTNLDMIMAEFDAIVCVAPITPGYQGDGRCTQARPGPAARLLVNVSRGPDLRPGRDDRAAPAGRHHGAFDVWDAGADPRLTARPQPPNVFLTPHILQPDEGQAWTVLLDDGGRARPLLPRPRDAVRPDLADPPLTGSATTTFEQR